MRTRRKGIIIGVLAAVALLLVLTGSASANNGRRGGYGRPGYSNQWRYRHGQGRSYQQPYTSRRYQQGYYYNYYGQPYGNTYVFRGPSGLRYGIQQPYVRRFGLGVGPSYFGYTQRYYGPTRLPPSAYGMDNGVVSKNRAIRRQFHELRREIRRSRYR